MRIKAKAADGVVTVKAMLKHPMLSYDQAKKQGKEANFIVYITGKVDGKTVYEASTSQFLSKNPYLKFKFKGEAGKELELSWVDLKGGSKTKKAKIK
jgi:sulfur-oxidizing protein SoxZ